MDVIQSHKTLPPKRWIKPGFLSVVSILAILASSSLLSASGNPAKPSPPTRPESGPGSATRYISPDYLLLEKGFYWNGSKVCCFVPKKLKYTTRAPVVVFLHGFKLVRPDFYLDFIKHIVKQGYIVIYPCSTVGSLLLSFLDTDQNVFMRRALENTAKGLSLVGSRADLSEVYVVGHSLGALLASCWIGSGGVRPRAIVMMNVSTNAYQGIPDFLKGIICINPIDWKNLAKVVDVPVVMLTGDRDTLAPPAQSMEMFKALVNAPSKALYCLQSDDRGFPPIAANHNMPLTSNWIYPEFLMDTFFGGSGKVDSPDWRFCWAAFDQVLDGSFTPTFDTGSWSDGTPVKPVLRLAP